jgi:hypothetical protein
MTKEELKEYKKAYYIANKDKRGKYRNLEKEKEYRKRNKDKLKVNRDNHYKKHKDTILAKNKIYNQTHVLKDRTEYFKRYNKAYRKIYLSNPLNLLRKRISTMILNSFKNKRLIKNAKTIDILGCSIPDFKAHLESQFKDWMTWENRGLYNGTLNYGWDIDHIKPLSLAKTEEEIIKLFHYTNLQPLCGYTNRVIKRANF